MNDKLSTNVEGIFACGNVLHVHDLVDFVSEEAAAAGKNAVAYIKRKEKERGCTYIEIKTEGGVRYTVPQKVNIEDMRDSLKVRFRVGDVYRDKFVSVYAGKECLIHKKKKIIAPGEMEEIILEKDKLMKLSYITSIKVCLEEV